MFTATISCFCASDRLEVTARMAVSMPTVVLLVVGVLCEARTPSSGCPFIFSRLTNTASVFVPPIDDFTGKKLSKKMVCSYNVHC